MSDEKKKPAEKSQPVVKTVKVPSVNKGDPLYYKITDTGTYIRITPKWS